MNTGEIYIANIPFEQNDDSKVRPCCVLIDNKDDTFTALPITSKTNYHHQYDVKLSGWKKAGLDRQSYVRCDKSQVIKKSDIQNNIGENGCIGTITDEDMKRVSQACKNYVRDVRLEKEIKNTVQTFQIKPENMAEFAMFAAKFHNYSYRNMLLIYSQNQYASFVKGYTQYPKDLKCNVKRGEKAMYILAPETVELFKRADNSIQRVTEATQDEKVSIAKGEIETWKKTYFKYKPVFDISQTDFPVDRYPEIFSKGFKSSQHHEMYEVLKKTLNNSGFEVIEKDLKSISLNGYYEPATDKIVISDKLNDTAALSTLAHEAAHGILHKNGRDIPSCIKEFEADTFSILLHRQYGLEISDTRKDHLTSSFKEIPPDYKLSKSFTKVTNAFDFLNDKFEKTAQEMGIDFSITHEKNQAIESAAPNAVEIKSAPLAPPIEMG